MLKTFTTTLLVSTTLATAALAQTAPTAAGSSGSMFVTDQKAGEFRASKFVGVDIYGSENQKIGDVNEILMDANGNAKAIVIGVGGFLGIGEKNVAVPFSAVEWKNERPAGDRTAAMTGSGGTTGSTTAAGTMAGGTTGTTTGSTTGNTAGTTAITPPTGPVAGATTPAPATTTAGGTTAASGTTASAPVPSTMTTGGATMTGAPGAAPAGQQTRSPAETAAINGYPDHGMVKMTKADLENAPTFRYYADASTANRSTGSGSGGATNTAPATTTPRQ